MTNLACCVVFLLCTFMVCSVLAMPLDCSTVRCADVTRTCSGAYTPPGQCCPVCPDCSAVLCLAANCTNPITRPGGCCPRCVNPCEGVYCLQIYCEGQFTPPGQCCPICPPDGETTS